MQKLFRYKWQDSGRIMCSVALEAGVVDQYLQPWSGAVGVTTSINYKDEGPRSEFQRYDRMWTQGDAQEWTLVQVHERCSSLPFFAGCILDPKRDAAGIRIRKEATNREDFAKILGCSRSAYGELSFKMTGIPSWLASKTQMQEIVGGTTGASFVWEDASVTFVGYDRISTDHLAMVRASTPPPSEAISLDASNTITIRPNETQKRETKRKPITFGQLMPPPLKTAATAPQTPPADADMFDLEMGEDVELAEDLEAVEIIIPDIKPSYKEVTMASTGRVPTWLASLTPLRNPGGAPAFLAPAAKVRAVPIWSGDASSISSAATFSLSSP